MAIHTLVFRTLLVLTVIALAAGCTDPEPNPPPPVSEFLEGHPLDMSADNISRHADGLPWLVSSDWYIAAGRTVTIQAGTEIMFDGLWWVDVEGKIDARGGEGAENSITFTSAYTAKDLGQWRGIKLRNSDPSQASVFQYCIFEYGAYYDDDTLTDRGKDAQNYRGMLSIRNSSPVIENCLVIYNQNNAIYISHDDTVGVLPQPQINYNILTKNDGAAVRTGAGVVLSQVHIWYNCVGDNSIIPFLLNPDQEDSTFGVNVTVNENLDSTDIYFNLDYVPQLANPEIGDYSLTSCSPCVDAGPAGSQEGDGSRFDLGPISYHQVPGELRGVISGTLNSDITYRMSCQVRVRQGEQLTIPAGTRIEATGAYNLEVFGRLDIAGTEGDSVTICPCQAGVDGRWGGLRFFNLDTISAPSIVRYANLEHYDQLDVVRPGVRFEHVRFDGGFFSGISVATGSADPAGAVVFQNCMITDCGSYGLGISASTASVHNTLIENVRGRGISMIGVGTGVEIFNSVVRTCSTSGIWMEDLCSPLIVNNVITDCSYHGLHLINNCLPTVMNTIVYANHRDGIRSELSSVPNLSYNNFAGNGLSNYNPASTACGDCISQDPLFVSNTDLHLGAGSPSIDAGNPDPSYNDANGSRNDQGAYGGPGGGVGILGPKGTVVMR